MHIVESHIREGLDRLRAYFTHSKRTGEDLKRLADQLSRHNVSQSEMDRAVSEAEDSCEHFPSGAKLLKMARPMGGGGRDEDTGFGCRYDTAFERQFVEDMSNAKTCGDRRELTQRHNAIVEARWRALGRPVKSSHFHDLDAVLEFHNLDAKGRQKGLQPL